MTIHLPIDLEASLRSLVQGGRYASVDDAMADAARILLREVNRQDAPPSNGTAPATGNGSIGAMHDAADELDEAMAEARRLRGQLEPPLPPAADADDVHDPILGLFQDIPELMDAIVAQAYRDREADARREIDV